MLRTLSDDGCIPLVTTSARGCAFLRVKLDVVGAPLYHAKVLTTVVSFLGLETYNNVEDCEHAFSSVQHLSLPKTAHKSGR